MPRFREKIEEALKLVTVPPAPVFLEGQIIVQLSKRVLSAEKDRKRAERSYSMKEVDRIKGRIEAFDEIISFINQLRKKHETGQTSDTGYAGGRVYGSQSHGSTDRLQHDYEGLDGVPG